MEFDSLQLNTQLSTHLINSTAQQPVDNGLVETALRTEDLISSRSLAQDFGFTGVPIKQAHSKLRNLCGLPLCQQQICSIKEINANLCTSSI